MTRFNRSRSSTGSPARAERATLWGWRTTVLGAGLAALLVAGCANQKPSDEPMPEPAPGTNQPPPVLQSPVVVTASHVYEPAGVMSLSAVNSVTLSAAVSGPTEGKTLAVELFSPQGFPYERREVVMTGANPKIDFPLPVAGTMVQMSRLTGTWSARFYVNGALAATREFQLSL